MKEKRDHTFYRKSYDSDNNREIQETVSVVGGK